MRSNKTKICRVEKEIDTHRKQQEKQIMISVIMMCINEPFTSDFKAEKSSETFAFFLIYPKSKIISKLKNKQIST